MKKIKKKWKTKIIKSSRKKPAKTKKTDFKILFSDVSRLIESAHSRVAVSVNTIMVMLYWSVGKRLQKEILKDKRAEYGKQILSTLSKELSGKFGKGFSLPNLSRMIHLAEVFPAEKIISTLSKQLSWSHLVEIIPLKDKLQRDFYSEMCRVEQWSVRTLHDKVSGMLYERTALSRKPEKLAKKEIAALRKEDKLSPDLVFRDPLFLDFLGLKDTYSEKDLETAILREMERFILELGSGIAFVARQKRMTVDHEDYYLDLLFYHRGLRRLVAVELKLDKFKAAYKGQMELYLRWLEKYEQKPGEDTPIGLILCAGKSSEHIELLQLEKSGIKVAQYYTELPKRKLLEQKLHKAVKLAQERLKQKND